MKVICAVLCVMLAALIPAAYSQEGCTSSCCDYDYKASTETCCKYWVCANGVETEMTCPGGMHWNAVSKVCDWPASAGCGTGTTTTTLAPTTTSTTTVAPTTTTTTTVAPTTTTTTTTTTVAPTTTTTTTVAPTTQPTTSTGGGGGVVTPTPDPGGCTGECECTTGTYDAIVGETCKYRVCDNGRWTTMSCAPGLIWNNTRKSCAWVECENCASSS